MLVYISNIKGDYDKTMNQTTYEKEVNFSELKGKTLKSIDINNQYGDVITFTTIDNEVFRMYHNQSCCEEVYIEDVCGELNLLLDKPILLAEEIVHEKEEDPGKEGDEYYTWTFYRLATIEGYVTIRWYGSSNGFYSERVDFYKIVEEEKLI